MVYQIQYIQNNSNLLDFIINCIICIILKFWVNFDCYNNLFNLKILINCFKYSSYLKQFISFQFQIFKTMQQQKPNIQNSYAQMSNQRSRSEARAHNDLVSGQSTTSPQLNHDLQPVLQKYRDAQLNEGSGGIRSKSLHSSKESRHRSQNHPHNFERSKQLSRNAEEGQGSRRSHRATYMPQKEPLDQAQLKNIIMRREREQCPGLVNNNSQKSLGGFGGSNSQKQPHSAQFAAYGNALQMDGTQNHVVNRQPPSVDAVSAGLNRGRNAHNCTLSSGETNPVEYNINQNIHSFGGSVRNGTSRNSRGNKQSQEMMKMNEHNNITLLDSGMLSKEETNRKDGELRLVHNAHEQDSEKIDETYLRPGQTSSQKHILSNQTAQKSSRASLPPIPNSKPLYSRNPVHGIEQQRSNFEYNPEPLNNRGGLDQSRSFERQYSFDRTYQGNESSSILNSKYFDSHMSVTQQPNIRRQNVSNALPPTAPQFINQSGPRQDTGASAMTHYAGYNADMSKHLQDSSSLSGLYVGEYQPRSKSNEQSNTNQLKPYQQPLPQKGLYYDRERHASEFTSPSWTSPDNTYQIQNKLAQDYSFNKYNYQPNQNPYSKFNPIDEKAKSLESQGHSLKSGSPSQNAHSYRHSIRNYGGTGVTASQRSMYGMQHKRTNSKGQGRLDNLYDSAMQNIQHLNSNFNSSPEKERDAQNKYHVPPPQTRGYQPRIEKVDDKHQSYYNQELKEGGSLYNDQGHPNLATHGEHQGKETRQDLRKEKAPQSMVPLEQPEIVSEYLQETNKILQQLSQNYPLEERAERMKNAALVQTEPNATQKPANLTQVNPEMKRPIEGGNIYRITEQTWEYTPRGAESQIKIADEKKNTNRERRVKSPLEGTRILDTVKRLNHISPSTRTASPVKMNLNLDKIDRKHVVTLGKFLTTNPKEQEHLEEIASRINSIQCQFLEQGFIEKDQENWINFESYQDTSSMSKFSIVDLLFDISIQHNWLAENVTQLVKDLQDGALASTRKSLQSMKENEQQQIQMLRERNQVLMSDYEKLKLQLHAKEEIISNFNNEKVMNCRIGQSLYGEKLPSTYQEYEQLLKQKELQINQLKEDNQKTVMELAKVDSDLDYYKKLSTTLETQVDSSDQILKEAIENVEKAEKSREELKNEVIKLFEAQKKNLVQMRAAETVLSGRKCERPESKESVQEAQSLENVLESFQSVIAEQNQEFDKLKKDIEDMATSKQLEGEKEEKFERQIETLKQVITLQETMNERFQKSTNTAPGKSFAESGEQANLGSWHDAVAQTEGIPCEHRTTQCEEKTYKDSYVQYNGADLGAAEAQSAANSDRSGTAVRGTKDERKDLKSKNAALTQEVQEQNFLIDQMKGMVKKAHRYQQFYQHQKTKKYRNCGVQVLSEAYVELTESQASQDNQKLAQENEIHLRKTQAYFQLIEVLQGELQEKSQIISQVKQHGISCLQSIQKFQESCIAKNAPTSTEEADLLKEEIASKFEAHQSSTIQDIMKLVAEEIDALAQYWISQMQIVKKEQGADAKDDVEPGEKKQGKKKKKYKVRYSTQSPVELRIPGNKSEKGSITSDQGERKPDKVPGKFIKLIPVGGQTKVEKDSNEKVRRFTLKDDNRENLRPVDTIDVATAIHEKKRNTTKPALASMTPTISKSGGHDALTPRSKSRQRKQQNFLQTQDSHEDERIQQLKQKMINQKDNNALLQQQIQLGYEMLKQHLFTPSGLSVKSAGMKDMSKISKNEESCTDKVLNFKDFKFADLDSVQQQDQVLKAQQVSQEPSFMRVPQLGHNHQETSQLPYTNSEKSFNYIEEYLSLKSQRNKDYNEAKHMVNNLHGL